eukprot:CAMPEP_0116853240 /NCGR_PEP_ID=MMETSP0418-20121206/17793_1 /TAXON_ID=1158023 /ORGANISM="Astrosyne radiata, Strain 13vi08-1A" /LENGTH=35 /DNA_ID= /DNA_START= /DNA_END= /DNA_ORIENTATION=
MPDVNGAWLTRPAPAPLGQCCPEYVLQTCSLLLLL